MLFPIGTLERQMRAHPIVSAMIDNFKDADAFSPRHMSKRLHLSLTDFARLARLSRTALERPTSRVVQALLEPIAKILVQVEALAGDADRAILWFRHQPLSGYDGRTAQDLVQEGRCDTVLAYLEDLRDGAYG